MNNHSIANYPNQFSIRQLFEFTTVTAILMTIQPLIGTLPAAFLSLYFVLLRLGWGLFALISFWLALGLASESSIAFVAFVIGLFVSFLAALQKGNVSQGSK